MPVDTSIYNNMYQPDPQAPLDMAAKVLALKGAAQQNKLLQIEVAKKQAMGDIYSTPGVVNGDGTVNYDKAMAVAKNNRLGGMLVPDLMQESLKANSLVNLQNKDGTPYVRPVQEVQRDARNGVAPQEAAPPQQQIDDYHDGYDYMKDRLLELMNKPDVSQKDIINAGADFIHNTHMTPAQIADELKNMPSEPNQIREKLQDYYNQALQNHTQLAAKYPRSSHIETPGVQTGPTPGTVENIQTNVQQATERKKQVNNDATSAVSTIPVLNKILDLSKEGIKTGPTREFRAKVGKFLADVGAPVDPKVGEIDELKKYMAQLAQSNAGNVPGTNEGLQALQAASPNDKILPEQVQNLSRFLLAVQKGKIAKQAVYNKNLEGKNGVEFSKAEEKIKQGFDENYDPRVLEIMMLSAGSDEQKKLVSKLSPEDKETLKKKRDELKKLGALDNLK